MELLTPVHIIPQHGAVTHHHRMMLFGSCFAEHIGSRLTENHFPVDVNPFGILYNPASIATSLSRLLDKRAFTHDDLFRSGNLWHSFSHHSLFSHIDEVSALRQMNDRFLPASEAIEHIDWLVLTWGTAWIYTDVETGAVVSNCHKLPAARFERRRLSVQDMADTWIALLSRLFAINKQVKVLITVSPIRHLKDGAHGNQLSKAALQLFSDTLVSHFPDRCVYFPTYEILLDELRDYRFYDTDMTHPSAQAVEYVWQRFSDTFFDETTRAVCKEWGALRRALNHRQLTPDGEAYRCFVMQNILKLENFREKYPFFDVTKELSAARQLLETLD